MQECIGGGAETMSLRDRILLKQEADVLIDAKAPLLLEILKWCKKEVGNSKLLVLDATPEHYVMLQNILQMHGKWL